LGGKTLLFVSEHLEVNVPFPSTNHDCNFSTDFGRTVGDKIRQPVSDLPDKVRDFYGIDDCPRSAKPRIWAFSRGCSRPSAARNGSPSSLIIFPCSGPQGVAGRPRRVTHSEGRSRASHLLDSLVICSDSLSVVVPRGSSRDRVIIPVIAPFTRSPNLCLRLVPFLELVSSPFLKRFSPGEVRPWACIPSNKYAPLSSELP
jgi:hypothetical protein